MSLPQDNFSVNSFNFKNIHRLTIHNGIVNNFQHRLEGELNSSSEQDSVDQALHIRSEIYASMARSETVVNRPTSVLDWQVRNSRGTSRVQTHRT